VSGRGAAVVVAIWAVLNALLAALLLGFRNNLVEMLSWAATVATLLAIVALALRSADRPMRRLPEASAGALVLAVAVTLLVLGAGVGLWAALIGAGLALVALVLLVREASE
jgi:drug/metabolite transporter (DMT)-like permease